MKDVRRLLRMVRGEHGVYMLELIMALAASGLLATALVANMAETQRFADAGQNQILAAAIAQEQIDNARNMSYGNLSGFAGTHTLLVNKTQSGETGPPVNPRPLLMDQVGLSWTDPTKKNMFPGTVTERIEPGPYPNTLSVTVTCTWREGQASRNYSLSTLVSQFGIHN